MSKFKLKGNPRLFNILKLQTSESSKKFKVAAQCWLSFIFLRIIFATTVLFWIEENFKYLSQYLQVHLHRTFLSATTIQSEETICQNTVFMCRIHTRGSSQFYRKMLGFKTKHVEDYLWVKSQVYPPISHISVTFYVVFICRELIHLYLYLLTFAVDTNLILFTVKAVHTLCICALTFHTTGSRLQEIFFLRTGY